MPRELNETDRKLLDQLQREVPLVRQPFAELARRVGGIDEAEAIERVRNLSGPPPAPIRQISAIFDSKRLGYQSCLVAAKVAESRLEHAAALINAHPGVSHNYKRAHAYNLWFTLALPPDDRLGLEGTISLLQNISGAEEMRLMPAIKLYKIGVKFDLGGGGDDAPAAATDTAAPNPASRSDEPADLTEIDKKMIRVLQQHLPLEARPFDAWAEQAGVTVEQLLVAAERFRDVGVMRRFSAVLRHREVGVSANAMGVWVVPPEKRDGFGQLAAQNPAVSHCYLRPTYHDWPYSLFTMVHGKSEAECEAALAAISLASGIKEYTSLYSTKEYKKVRVKYFVGDVEKWEDEHSAELELACARPY